MTANDFPATGVTAGPQDFQPRRIPLHDLKPPPPGEVHVWHLDLGRLGRSLQGALGAPEEASPPDLTAVQLRFARRFFLRLLLGAYLGMPGKDVRINRKLRGKPVLDASAHDDPLHFSMAKSEDRLLIGFSSSGYLGVDLEPAGREARNALAVAKRYFSPTEAKALSSMPPDQINTAFLRAWACKEAVVKASGKGIANQLARFTVETDLRQPPALLEFEGQDHRSWSLHLLRPEEDFVGALAWAEPGMEIRPFRLSPAERGR